ncbi:hypothetical protein [Caulobacter sp. FWC2]|uniref:hypothetical protein n=1 Tax=Caulobacter sp. FWC2 TaxID=69664 RepID=UPI000C15B6A2|nr:hypothetical protein [Caulobacter sp. FWC2]PIB91273.1 hypothetical protein CSW62_06605 [Caulobacter sp. FWC2]
MSAAVHTTPKAAVGVDGAQQRSWLSAVGEELRLLFGRRTPTPHEAAQVLGRAAAAKRQRDNLTLEERKADKIAQLRAECDAGLVCGRPRQ